MPDAAYPAEPHPTMRQETMNRTNTERLLIEHPFAPYIRILGKGRKGSRDMTFAEAYAAMRLMASGQTEPLQDGAFLMLLRVKEESAAELAGFVSAWREVLHSTEPATLNLHPDVDWASYAGKRRQLPWFVLSALLLAEHGIKVLMHGTSGFDPSRCFVPETLQALELPLAGSIGEAGEQLAAGNFAFLSLDKFLPRLDASMKLRPLLGLRSPVNTIARMINPCNAAAMMQGVFHPGYLHSQQQAAALLGFAQLAIIKGDGGEAELMPDRSCRVTLRLQSVDSEEEIAANLEGGRRDKVDGWPADQHLASALPQLVGLWRGQTHSEYGTAAVIATAAMALRLHRQAQGEALSQQQALQQAGAMWAAHCARF